MMKSLRVFVYKNLHKDCFSVRSVETGRVIAHVASLQIRNAIFKVSRKGRERVVSELRKNVHAGIEGELVIDPSDLLTEDYFPRPILYDPYRYRFFVDIHGYHVGWASQVYLKDGKVWATLG